MKASMNNISFWVDECRPDFLIGYFSQLLKDCGFKIVDSCVHFFEPFGFTSLHLLSESHFAIHTFPERGKSYCELSSCVKPQFDRFVEHLDKDSESPIPFNIVKEDE